MAPETASAIGTSRSSAGIAAHAAVEKTRKSGPGGCQRSASEASEPRAATPAVTGIASQARCGETPTRVPRPTARVR